MPRVMVFEPADGRTVQSALQSLLDGPTLNGRQKADITGFLIAMHAARETEVESVEDLMETVRKMV